jgi:hypothetical protein
MMASSWPGRMVRLTSLRIALAGPLPFRTLYCSFSMSILTGNTFPGRTLHWGCTTQNM